MKVLVTGAGGFLGGAIARQLVARGDTVHSFSRGDYAELAELGVVQFRGDIGSATAVARAVEGCDAVYHVAAKAGSWGTYEDYHRTNVRGTEHVLAACRQNSIRDLVYTSSPSVVVHTGDMEGVDETAPYPDHFEAHYPETKSHAERLVLAASCDALHTAALRPHFIWGPRDTSILPRLIQDLQDRLMKIGGWVKASGHNSIITEVAETTGLSGYITFLNSEGVRDRTDSDEISLGPGARLGRRGRDRSLHRGRRQRRRLAHAPHRAARGNGRRGSPFGRP